MWNIGIFHIVHTREAGALRQAHGKLIQGIGHATGHDLDPPIRQIPRPADKTQGLRPACDEPAESNSLHTPGHQPGPRLNRLVHRGVPPPPGPGGAGG